MKKLIKDWDDLLAYEKVFRILQLLFSIAVLVSSILTICDVMHMAMLELLLSGTLLCQSINLWRTQRRLAIFNLVTAIIIILVTVVIVVCM